MTLQMYRHYSVAVEMLGDGLPAYNLMVSLLDGEPLTLSLPHTELDELHRMVISPWGPSSNEKIYPQSFEEQLKSVRADRRKLNTQHLRGE